MRGLPIRWAVKVERPEDWATGPWYVTAELPVGEELLAYRILLTEQHCYHMGIRRATRHAVEHLNHTIRVAYYRHTH